MPLSHRWHLTRPRYLFGSSQPKSPGGAWRGASQVAGSAAAGGGGGERGGGARRCEDSRRGGGTKGKRFLFHLAVQLSPALFLLGLRRLIDRINPPATAAVLY